ncbi:multidrug effflux MFS transporter [Aurantimicrobium photophilum]|uniref:Bicyclomycin resistance protein n=1 Tax=Aurantimicrobium photophilum TaxID=1987356 RepID=A0A2Z3RVL7_9MICO|nr:multidrug effflux MFS transporter [Aurantimicrobium photophilum]AWR20671.1 Bicyclomycin resistance protein [Aurantimicrobium photophilum]
MTAIYKGLVTVSMIIALGAVGVLGPFGTDMYLPAFPVIAEDLHTTAARVQITLSAFTIGMAVGQLILGSLSDRYGRRKLLLLGTATMAVSAAVSANSPTISGLAIGCAVMGISAASGLVVGRAVVSDLSSGREAARIFAILGLIAGLGPIAGPLGGAVAMGILGNWRGIFWLLAAASIVILVLVYFLVPETLAPERRHAGGLIGMLKTGLHVVRNRNFLYFSMTLWFGFGMMFAYISASPFIVQSLLGFSPIQYTLVFAINGAGLVLTGFFTSRLAKVWDPNRIIRIGVSIQVSAGLIVLLMAITGIVNAWILLPALFVMASSMGFIFGPATALALREVRQSSGTALAISGALQFMCAALAAPLVGLGGKNALFPFAIVAMTYTLLALTGLIAGNKYLKNISQLSPTQ